MARRLPPRLSPGIAADLPVVERRLDNGLTALVLPRRGTPVVVVDLYYPVGSFNEPPGLSGLAHFVEHMLFKGTERFPKGQIDRMVTAAGGHCNAETGEDSTHYWFTFPAEGWEQALAIEADRMCHARFHPAEVELERRVIGEERARELGSPQGRLDQDHLAVTYLRHPYRNPILGWPEDAARIGVEDLTDPSIDAITGPMARCSWWWAMWTRTGPSTGSRRRSATRLGPIGAIAAGDRRAPPGGSARLRAGRARRRRAGAPGLAHRAARAPRRRRARRPLGRAHQRPTVPALALARREHVGWRPGSRRRTRRPSAGGQFLIPLDSDSAARARARSSVAILAELERLAEDGPTPGRAGPSRGAGSSRPGGGSATTWAALASGLGHAALWGDWRTWPAEHRAAIDVTAREIRRVAAEYLDEQGLTAGWIEPRGVSEAAGRRRAGNGRRRGRGTASRARPAPILIDAVDPTPVPDPIATPAVLSPFAGVSRLSDYRPRRGVLENGLRLRLGAAAGDGGRRDRAVLRRRHHPRGDPGPGGADRPAAGGGDDRARRRVDRAGDRGRRGARSRSGATGASIRIRAEDLAPSLELLAELVQRPAFPDEAIARISRRMAAELRGDLDDPAFRAELSFRGAGLWRTPDGPRPSRRPSGTWRGSRGRTF